MILKTKHDLYRVWSSMKERCRNKKYRCWHRYGGRGITVCEEWTSFEKFIEDMGPRPTKEHSLDRVNNDLGYYKDNCRWATQREQHLNRGITVILNFDGVDYFLSDLSKNSGLKPDTIKARHERGLSYEDAIRKTRYTFTGGVRRAIEVRVANQATATHCKRGHEWTPENTGFQKGGRLCKACDSLRGRLKRGASEDRPVAVPKSCSTPNCNRPYRAKGMCNNHYEQLRLRGGKR